LPVSARRSRKTQQPFGADLRALGLLDVAHHRPAAGDAVAQPALEQVWPGLVNLAPLLGQLRFAQGGVRSERKGYGIAGVHAGGAEQLDLEDQLVVAALAGQKRDAVEVVVETEQRVDLFAGVEGDDGPPWHIDPADQGDTVEFSSQPRHGRAS
jgi:hypothetical protein